MSVDDFIQDRDSALLSLDKQKILAYAKKYHVKLPDNDLVFWASVHKAILVIDAPAEAKEKSRTWLKQNGFNEKIKGR